MNAKDDHHASISNHQTTAAAGLPMLGTAVPGSAPVLRPAQALRLAGAEQLHLPPGSLLPATTGRAAHLARATDLAAHRGNSDPAI